MNLSLNSMKRLFGGLAIVSLAAVAVHANEPEPATAKVPEDRKKVCDLLEKKKTAKYQKFVESKKRYEEKDKPALLVKNEKAVRKLMVRPERLLNEAKKILSRGNDPKTGEISDLVYVLNAYGHEEWFKDDPRSEKEFATFITEEVEAIEKEARSKVDSSFSKSDFDRRAQEERQMRSESIDIKFYAQPRVLAIIGCMGDLYDKSIDWQKLGQPVCIELNIPVKDFNPLAIDVKAAAKDAVKGIVAKLTAIKEVPPYYASLDKYLDQMLPSFCRPNKKPEPAPSVPVKGEDLLNKPSAAPAEEQNPTPPATTPSSSPDEKTTAPSLVTPPPPAESTEDPFNS